jgi:S1-C subfamily serine protease
MDSLAKINPGDEVEVVFTRNGESKTVKIKFD